MKSIITLLLVSLTIAVFSQTNLEDYTLLNALGKVHSKKEYKGLAGMKCFVVGMSQVQSNANDIAFNLNRETQEIESIDISEEFLNREPYLSEPLFNLKAGMSYDSAYALIKTLKDVEQLSEKDAESKYFSFYAASQERRYFFNVFFSTKEEPSLELDRILAALAQKD